MRIPRIYQPVPLEVGSVVNLDAQATAHIVRVLRLKQDDTITLFNGEGGEYDGIITQAGKRETSVRLLEFHNTEKESPVKISLLQGVSRGERMDYTLQKAVELGVNKIYPVLTKHTAVQLDEQRKIKRQQHWQGVVNSSCEQCGRNQIPQVHMVEPLFDCLPQLAASNDDLCVVLNHRAAQSISGLADKKPGQIFLLAGPEGGFAESEIDELHRQGFISLVMGPRVLRTETAALVALSLIQSMWGDFSK